MAMGVPGWPELAAWTASMESVRMVLMHVASSGWRCDLISGLCSTATVMDAPSVLKPGGAGQSAILCRFGCRIYRDFRRHNTSRLARPRLGIVPAADVGDHMVGLCRPPGVGLVFEDGVIVLEHRVDDAPRLLDVVLACEQRGVSLHGFAQQPFVRTHLFGGRVAADEQLRRDGRSPYRRGP